MQIVIDIPDVYYEALRETDGRSSSPQGGKTLMSVIYNAVAVGTPLPEGHGRLIDADALVDSLSSSDRDIYCKAVIEEEASTILAADNKMRNEYDGL